MYKYFLCFLFFIFTIPTLTAQDISLFSQFNGRYDYLAIGGSFNNEENSYSTSCSINNSSQATLDLQPNASIIAAHLYWSGSGSGDFDIELNGQPITAERTFNATSTNGLPLFAAFTDVTEEVSTIGNGIYEITEFDLTNVIAAYCPESANYGGWAINIIYEDNNLPLNQINVYDGLEAVPEMINISLQNLNVTSTEGAKIGFIAWEGDGLTPFYESVTVNGYLLSNPPLNYSTNIFNGSNSFTGEFDFPNVDIDFFNIENFISVGDTSVEFQISSGLDFVLINNVIIVLNNPLADATVNITSWNIECENEEVLIDYTISNLNSTEILPAGTEFQLEMEGNILISGVTPQDIPINGTWDNSASFSLPFINQNGYNIHLVLDPDNFVAEINEENNSASIFFNFENLDPIPELPGLLNCNEGNAIGNYDLTVNNSLISAENDLEISFFNSFEDAEHQENEILTPNDYQSQEASESIFVRYENEDCYNITSFVLETENCPPFVPQGFSPNGDGINDTFEISGLYDIFTDFELTIFTRLGNKIYVANNNVPEWDGTVNAGINTSGKVPSGTYYYILNLNDPEYKTITGWVYLNR